MTKADKEGQRKAPILRFKGFTDDWEQRKLGEIGKVRSCKRIYRNQTSNIGEIPFYKIGTFGKEADSFISRELYEEYKEKFSFPQVGDVLISASGTLGRIVVYSGENAYFQDSNIVWLDNDNHLALNKYLEIYYQRIHWKASEGSTIKRLYNSDIEKTIISIPKRDEQAKISECLKLLNKVVTLYERKLKLLSKIKKYFLDNLFAEKEYPNLRFKGFTNAWEQRQLGEIGTTYSGLSGKNKSDFEKGNSNFVTFLEVLNNPVLKNIDLTNKVEIKENEHQNKVKRNDILFNTSSETPEEVATSTVVDVNQDNLYLNSFCFGFRPNVQFSNYYIGYYLRSNHFRSRVFCLAQGISRYNISKKSLIKLKLSLPKLEEQDKISRIFNQIELLLTLYENKQQYLTEIKKTLLNTMFI